MASLRLRIPVSLKTLSKSTFSLYILIDTDRIFTVEEITDVPGIVMSKLQSESAGERLGVKRLGGRVIVPADVHLAPKTKAASTMLDIIDSFRHATEILLYSLCKSLSKSRIQSMCDVSPAPAWRYAPKLSDVSTLYSGRAKVLEGSMCAPAPAGPAAESSPSYDELALTPPATRAAGKRRRTRSSPVGGTQTVEDVCRRLLEETQTKLDAQLELNTAELLRRVAEARAETRRQVDEDVKGKLDEIEKRVLAKLEDRVEEKTAQLRGELND